MRTAPQPGPLARLIRARALARAGMRLPSLQQRSIDVGDTRRTYTVLPGPHERSPLLLVLHGAGGQGVGMAALCGLAERGPRAGFAVAFPDGWARIWNDHRMAPRIAWREGVDDVAFLSALCTRLIDDGIAAADRMVAVGISNGAFMAEHLARHELLPLSGIVLVAGGATDASVRTRARPPAGVTVLAFHGTADPLVPYEGGPIGRRRSERPGGRGHMVGIEQTCGQWARANGCDDGPVVAALEGELPVSRLDWPGGKVTLYRIDGGGHTWPGGAPYLPERMIGAVARDLDATGILLDTFGSG
jgi:polyhydroxybutyrate depolymerase